MSTSTEHQRPGAHRGETGLAIDEMPHRGYNPPMSTPQQSLSLGGQIASQAEFIVNNLTETHYTYEETINVNNGVYDCDCSEFVSLVLKEVVPNHYAQFAATTPHPRPLAGDFYQFLPSSFSSPPMAGAQSVL
jgi:hypothetical protein